MPVCLCVQLVALIESLQFRKIGRVYSKPASRIQMLQNVALALQAIADDHIRLVNIGESGQTLCGVALAMQAIADDHIHLFNIGGSGQTL